MENGGNSEAVLAEGFCLPDTEPTQVLPGMAVIQNSRANRMAPADAEPF